MACTGYEHLDIGYCEYLEPVNLGPIVSGYGLEAGFDSLGYVKYDPVVIRKLRPDNSIPGGYLHQKISNESYDPYNYFDNFCDGWKHYIIPNFDYENSSNLLRPSNYFQPTTWNDTYSGLNHYPLQNAVVYSDGSSPFYTYYQFKLNLISVRTSSLSYSHLKEVGHLDQA